MILSAISHTSNDGNDELNRRQKDSWQKMLSVETSSWGQTGNDKVKALVGFFCGVSYGLILGCGNMDDHVTRYCMEQIDAPGGPQERTCTTMAPVPPVYRHTKPETAQADLRIIRSNTMPGSGSLSKLS